MKKLSQLKSSGKKMLSVQDDTINFIPANDLKKYIEVTDKFICDETKELVQYLIVNNSHYVDDLAPSDVDNTLEYFYNNGPYKESHLSELYALIGKINKQNRLLEIPVFQTKEQFYGIINKEFSPDEVIIDLTSESGRNAVAKKYDKLCYKIALSFNGKTNIPFDDLLMTAYEGLTLAMNMYCKKSNKLTKKDEFNDEETDITNYKTTTFLTFASYIIRFTILDSIKREAHLVRIPANKQAEERKEKGYNTKNTEVSGDTSVGGDNKEGKNKSLFDVIAGTENTSKDVDDQDIKMVWDMLMKRLTSCGKFSEKMLNAWIQFNQLNNTKKKKNKDIANELGISPANVTYYCSCINNFILNDPETKKIAKELILLFNENLQRYYNENDEEPLYIQLNEVNTSEE